MYMEGLIARKTNYTIATVYAVISEVLWGNLIQNFHTHTKPIHHLKECSTDDQNRAL